MNERHSNHRILLLLLACNAMVLGVIFLIPFNSDLDLYHSMGLELTRGKLPYLGSWDHNFPAIVYVHAVAIALFGKGYIGFRILDFIAHLGTVLILYRIALRYASPIFAGIGATLNSLYYVGGSYWLAGQKDGFAVLFIAISVLLYFRALESKREILTMTCSGAAIAIAIAFRPTYALFSLSILAMIAIQRGGWRSAGSFAIGHAAVWVMILLPYVFAPNGLAEFFNSTVLFNLQVYGGARGEYFALGLLRFPLVLVALPVLLPWWDWMRTRWGTTLVQVPRSEILFGVLALLSAWLSIYIMGKFLVYHFDPFMAVIAVIAARGLQKTYYLIPIRAIGIVAMCVIFAYLTRQFYPFNLLHDLRDAMKTNPNSLLSTVWESVKTDSLFGFKAELEATNYLETHTDPKDRIEVCSDMPALRWRVDREESSPFSIPHPYTMRLPGHPFTKFQQKWREEFANDLRLFKPKYIVLATEPHTMELYSGQSPAESVMNIPEAKSLIEREYTIDTIFGPYIYYKYLAP